MNEEKAVMFIFKATIMALIGITTLAYAATSDAAMLKSEFVNDDGDRICIYEKHFREVYINVGFTGICHFNIPDSEL